MSWLDGFKHRVRTVFNPSAYERELEDEMRFHEDLDVVQQQDARRARRRFGNRTYYKEETRRMTWLGSLDVLQQDSRYAWRAISRTPSFTLLIVITLALGIGVNTATYSVLDRLYLRPPGGVADPGNVRRIWLESFRMEGGAMKVQAMNYPMFRAVAEASGTPEQVAAVTRVNDFRLGGTRRGVKVEVTFATANYFAILGVRPALGRFYTGDEDHPGFGVPVVVVSNRFWRDHLGSDTAIIGKTIRLGTKRYTVIGVAPKSFTGVNVEPTQMWMPMASYPQPSWMKTPIWDSRAMYGFHALMRTAPGADLAGFERRASHAVRPLTSELAKYADTLMNVYTGSIIEARGPGKPDTELVIGSRLAGVAAIVLLIACANVVNLLLARAVKRRREIAVRLALGISRGRLVRLLTTETVLLALAAAFAALLAGWWGGSVLRSLLLPDVEWIESAMHWRVLTFTVGVALTCGLVAGIIPAIQFSRPQLGNALKEGSRDGSVHRSRLRTGLLVTQAALSVMLLVGAVLFVRSLRNVQDLDIGYDAKQLLFADVGFDPGQNPPDAVVAAKVREIGQRLQTRPGIEGVARVLNHPMEGMSFWSFHWGPGGMYTSDSLRGLFPVVSVVSPEFFPTAGVRLLRGSVFDDGVSGQIVVNEAMAKLLWPRADALGQCIYVSQVISQCQRVVGVVETARRDKLIEEAAPQFYVPLGSPIKETWYGSTLVVRVSAGAAAIATREIRSELQRAFPAGEPVIRAMTENLEPQYRPWRLGASLFFGFGMLALIVAVIGIYSSVSYSVSQRTHEFGVRVALGARVHDVLQLVVGEGVRVVALGVVIGIALALAAGRLIAALLFGIGPSDPGVILFVSAIVLIVAAFATLLPAWRAARVDPVTALRAD